MPLSERSRALLSGAPETGGGAGISSGLSEESRKLLGTAPSTPKGDSFFDQVGKAWDYTKPVRDVVGGVLDLTGAGTGAVAGVLAGAAGSSAYSDEAERRYVDAINEKRARTGDPNADLSFFEQASLAPRVGDVLTSAWQPTSRAGAAGKNIASLGATILTDPATFTPRGLATAATALKSKELGKLGKAREVAEGVLGSPVPASIYLPDIARGVTEGAREAAAGFREGDYLGGLAQGGQAALLAALGGAMGSGLVKDVGGLRAPAPAAPTAPRPDPVAPFDQEFAPARPAPASPFTDEPLMRKAWDAREAQRAAAMAEIQRNVQNIHTVYGPQGAQTAMGPIMASLAPPPQAMAPSPFPNLMPGPAEAALAAGSGEGAERTVGSATAVPSSLPADEPGYGPGRAPALDDTADPYSEQTAGIRERGVEVAQPPAGMPWEASGIGLSASEDFNGGPSLILRNADGDEVGRLDYHVNDDGGLWIDGIDVGPEHQRRGYGRALVDLAERRTGAKLDLSNTMLSNTGGRALYESIGRERGVPPAQVGRGRQGASPPEAGTTPRGTDRRTPPPQPVAVDRRQGVDRRAIAAELGLPEDSPVVQRVVAAEERAAAAETRAARDPLTGLLSRDGWTRRQQSTPDKAVVAFDMAKFKALNDKYGHGNADLVLKSIGDILVRETGADRAARPTGDEFYAGADSLEEAQRIAAVLTREAPLLEVSVAMPDGTTEIIRDVRVHAGVGEADAQRSAQDNADFDLNARAKAERAARQDGRGLAAEAGGAPVEGRPDRVGDPGSEASGARTGSERAPAQEVPEAPPLDPPRKPVPLEAIQRGKRVEGYYHGVPFQGVVRSLEMDASGEPGMGRYGRVYINLTRDMVVYGVPRKAGEDGVIIGFDNGRQVGDDAITRILTDEPAVGAGAPPAKPPRAPRKAAPKPAVAANAALLTPNSRVFDTSLGREVVMVGPRLGKQKAQPGHVWVLDAGKPVQRPLMVSNTVTVVKNGEKKKVKLPPTEGIFSQDDKGLIVFPEDAHMSSEERAALDQTAKYLVAQLGTDGGRKVFVKQGQNADADAQGGGIDRVIGLPSDKNGTVFEDIPESPREMKDALERDKGNALERRLRAAAHEDETFQEWLGQRAGERGEGDASFDPTEFEARREPLVDDIKARKLGLPDDLKNDLNLLRDVREWGRHITTPGNEVRLKDGTPGRVVSVRDGVVSPSGEIYGTDHALGKSILVAHEFEGGPVQRFHSPLDLDFPEREARRGPYERTKLGDQALIPGTLDAATMGGLRRKTEGREAEGPLFTQEQDRQALALAEKEAIAQGKLFEHIRDPNPPRPPKPPQEIRQGTFKVDNPDESTADLTQRYAEAVESLLPKLAVVVTSAARRAGLAGVRLAGASLSQRIRAAIKGNEIRLGIMAHVEKAVEVTDARFTGLSPRARKRYIVREVARRITNDILHELAHADADRRKADVASPDSPRGEGHGTGYWDSLRKVYAAVGRTHSVLRRSVESALDAEGGAVGDSLLRLWADVAPRWGHDAEGGPGVLRRDGRNRADAPDRHGEAPGRPGGGEARRPGPGARVQAGAAGPAPEVGARAEVRGRGPEVSRLQQAADEARARMQERAAKLGRGTLNSAGTAFFQSALNMAGLATIGAAHMANGLRVFGAWSRKMIREFGDGVRTLLKGVFRQSSAAYKAGRAQSATAGAPPPSRPSSSPKPAAGEPKAGEIGLPKETRGQALERYWIDSTNRLKTLMGAVRGAGGKVTDSTDVATRRKLFDSQTNHRIEEARKKYQSPLLDVMKAHRILPDELRQYLLAKHAPTANAIAKKRVGAESAYGMTDADAQKHLASIPAERRAQLEQAAGHVRKITAEQRRVMVESGLESAETIAAWEKKFGPDYVPVKTFDEDPLLAFIASGDDIGRHDVMGHESKMRLAQEEMPDDPVAFALHGLERTIVRAEKNRLAQDIAQLVKDNPSKLWAVDKEHRKPAGETEGGAVKWERDHVAELKDLHYKVAGKTHRIFIDDPVTMAVLKGNDKQTGQFLRTAAKVTRLWSGLVTKWSPEFILTNPLRDVQQVLASAGVEHGKDAAKKIAGNLRAAMAAMYRMNGEGGDAAWKKLAREFMQDGGLPEAYVVRDPKKISKEMADHVQAGTVKRHARAVKEWVENANRAAEGGIRLAVYRAMRDAGKSRQQAAKIAREMGVDFGQKGEAGPAINALYAFFNANLQGSKRLYEVLNSKRGAALGASIVTAGVLVDQLNRAVASDSDDDGRNDYDAIPEHIKERNLIIPTGGTPLMVPLPWGYNVVFNTGRLMSAAASGGMDPKDAGAALAGGIVGAFNPIGSEESLEQFFAPTLLDPLVQLSTNKTFAAKPISPESYPGQKVPDSERYFRNASEGSKKAARALNAAFGGDEITSAGWADVSPNSIDHVVGWAFGGAGRFLGQAVDLGGKVAAGEVPSVRDVPFARRLVYEPHPGEASGRFRENADLLETEHTRYKHYREKGDRDGMKSVSMPLLRAKRAFDRYEAQIRSLNRQAREQGVNVDDRVRKLQTKANKIVEAARRAPQATQ
jgi:diguanylate cyclase (GGDEF)-like protein